MVELLFCIITTILFWTQAEILIIYFAYCHLLMFVLVAIETEKLMYPKQAFVWKHIFLIWLAPVTTYE